MVEAVQSTGDNTKELFDFCIKAKTLSSHSIPHLGNWFVLFPNGELKEIDKYALPTAFDIMVPDIGCAICSNTKTGFVCQSCYDEVSKAFDNTIVGYDDCKTSLEKSKEENRRLRDKYDRLVTRHDANVNNAAGLESDYDDLVGNLKDIVFRKANKIPWGVNFVDVAYVTEKNIDIVTRVIHELRLDISFTPNCWVVIDNGEIFVTNDCSYFHQHYALVAEDGGVFPEESVTGELVSEPVSETVSDTVGKTVTRIVRPTVRGETIVSGSQVIRDQYTGCIVYSVTPVLGKPTKLSGNIRAIRTGILNIGEAHNIIRAVCPNCRVKVKPYMWFVFSDNGRYEIIATHTAFHNKYQINKQKIL